MQKKLLLIGCLTGCVAVLFAADEQRLNVKPGLWQVDYKVKYSGLPPQTQAMIDHMTAQQKSAMGIEAPKAYKLCVREKDLNKAWTQGHDNCPLKVVKSTSTDLELHRDACRADHTEIDLKFHAVDSENVLATMHGTGTQHGANITLDGNYAGKWLGSTCPADMK